MKVAVTGGAGYIGAFTVRALLEAGHEVRVLDDLSTGHREALAGLPLRFEQLDLCRDPLEPALDGVQAVVHFAGKALVPESVREPALYYRVNAVGSLRLLEAMHRVGARAIVFSSTCATYGVPDAVPIAEDHPQRPVTAYGSSKLSVEHMLRDVAHAWGFGAVALRYFNAAGAAADGSLGEDHDPETHLIPRILEAARTGTAVQIFGTDLPTRDGTCVRDYIHVDDLARAHRLALERAGDEGLGRFEAFNLGTGRGSTVREVIAAAREATGREIVAQPAPPRPGDPPALVADARRARERLGFEPEHDLDAIVRSAWAWHRSHPAGYASDNGAVGARAKAVGECERGG
ncbi:MAG: UDP-glucose 4-epimerase GalE [Planctomycetota bacterium]|nr:MAG: UDP-glucose 4-epimerase GalE [Planctomycetota bacterium]